MTTNPLKLDADSFASPSPDPSGGRWWVIAIAIGLVLIPTLWTVVPAEIARWYSAAAAEAELQDQLSRAVERMDKAIEWSPRDANLYAYRASLKLAVNDLQGALEDADRSVRLSDAATIYPLFQRVLVHQRRGDHPQALRDVDQIVQLTADRPVPEWIPPGGAFSLDYDHVLNLRAYARALASQDIKRGLEDIDEAFRRAGTEEIDAYLDTRGYLHYLDGDLPAALKDLDRAVKIAEGTMQEFDEAAEAGKPPLSGRDALLWKKRQRQYRENLAVMLHHRGLVYEAAKRPEEADEDFRRARQYGYSPENGVW